jgi:predicted DNA-binding protein YlxM (UPF0122 family)
MSIFIKIDISKPSIIAHFKKKVSIIINIEQKFGNYIILRTVRQEMEKKLKTRLKGQEMDRK